MATMSHKLYQIQVIDLFTADCLRHPIQMAGTETIWELHTLSVIYSWSYLLA